MPSLEERRLAATIAGLQKEVRGATTTQQLAYSSIENGGKIVFRDGTGRDTLEVGGGADGSTGVNPINGPTPPQATAPKLTPTPGGFTIRWDGEYLDSVMTPMDFSRVEAHVSTSEGMAADTAATLVGTFETPRGGDVVVTKLKPGTVYYAALVVRNASGGRGPVSPKASGKPLAFPDGPGTAEAVNQAALAQERAREAREAADAASIKANEAAQDAITAEQAATSAILAANGKSKLWYSRNAPTSADGDDGDTWYLRDSSGSITAVYEKAGGQWASRTMNSSVIDSLSAGKITTGTLSASTTITTGNPQGTHTVLGASSLQVWRPDGDGDPQPTISIGGTSRDVLLIADPDTGATLAGFDGDGGGSAISFYTNELTVGGSSVGYMYQPDDILFQFPRGRVARYRVPQDSGQAGTTPLGVAEVNADLPSDREYRVRFTGNMFNTALGQFRLFFYWTRDGSTPQIYGNQLTMGIFNVPAANGHTRVDLEGNFWLPSSAGAVQPVRILLAIQKVSGGGTVKHHSDSGATPGHLYIEDMGLKPMDGTEVWGDGQMSGGGGSSSGGGGTYTPPVPRKTYTKIYPAAWSRNWRSGSAVDNEIRQGSYSARYYGALGFPSQVQSDLSGASVKKIELYIYANHWYYNSGGTAVIGYHGSSSVPSAFPGNGSTFTKKWSTKSGGQWITIPSTWYQYWASGAHRGFTFGDGASTDRSYYGRFNGAGARYSPALRVTYLK